jgi:hypothetical protein
MAALSVINLAARNDQRGYLAERVDFEYSGVAGNVAQNSLADHFIWRSDQRQRGLDRNRARTGRAVNNITSVHWVLNFQDQRHFRRHHRHVAEFFEQRSVLSNPRSETLEGGIDTE